MRRYMIGLLVIPAIITISCSRSTAPDNGDNTPPPPQYTVNGVFEMEAIIANYRSPVFSIDGAIITLNDTLGQSISSATVVVNGDTIPYTGIYLDTVNVRYVAGYEYTLSVYIDSLNNLTATVQAPDVDSIRILSPALGDTLPYDSLTLQWEYYGNPATGTTYILVADTMIEVSGTSYTLDSTLVKNILAQRQTDNLMVGVLIMNGIYFPELVEGSSFFVGTGRATGVIVDTTR